ncbi:MAG: hypothetical protein AAFZ52_09810, partial [Bacteroidota bacterium]
LEDSLNYIEPPDWFFAVRHHLGAVLLEAGENARASQVFRKDLEKFPRNGWALSGLVAAYRGQGMVEKAVAAEAKQREAWQHAEIVVVGGRAR